MRRDAEVLEEYTDEGFGPGMDLAFSVLAVVLVMFAVLRGTALMLSGETNLSLIYQEKRDLLAELRAACGDPTKTDLSPDSTIAINTQSCDLKLVDDPQFQTMVFNEGVLFAIGKSDLKQHGIAVLGLVRQVLSDRQQDISEIQIIGNTDTKGDQTYNFGLGYQRALAVYNLLTDDNAPDRINPFRSELSLTTFGYFNPVARGGHAYFPEDDLARANAAQEDRDRNRRIELKLYYLKAKTGSKSR